MKKEIIINNQKIEYDHRVKRVKNINLRIKSDGTVTVSSGYGVSGKAVEDFLVSKGKFILDALEKFRNKKEILPIKFFDEKELTELIHSLCKMVFPYFENRGVKYPEIRFRKMKSQWGNCYPKMSRLTFSTNLMYTPPECIEYVVCHEFTHFIVADHSAKFYEELSKICPQWQSMKKTLKNYTF